MYVTHLVVCQQVKWGKHVHVIIHPYTCTYRKNVDTAMSYVQDETKIGLIPVECMPAERATVGLIPIEGLADESDAITPATQRVAV